MQLKTGKKGKPLLLQLVLGLSQGGQATGAGSAAHRGDGGKQVFSGDSCLGLRVKASSSVSRQ